MIGVFRNWQSTALRFFGVVGAGYLFYRQQFGTLKREKRAHHMFAQQLIASQETERKRIATDLHDSLGQSLIVLKNRALISLSKPDDHERMLEQMAEISEAASAAIAEVRAIAGNLHPYQLDLLGLTSALESMVQSVFESAKIQVVHKIANVDGLFSKAEEINLYRIVQESVNNAVKHSEATKAVVLLTLKGQDLDLKIEDNGKGFLLISEDHKHGLGLVAMGERADMLQARLEVLSSAGGGTRVHLHINDVVGKS